MRYITLSSIENFEQAVTTWAFPVDVLISFATSSPNFVLRTAKYTRAPALANSIAVSLPIPLVAPDQL